MDKKKKPKKKKAAENGRKWQPSPQLRVMAEMLVNPDDKRTKAEKIKEAGLSERTFYRWMQDERYINYVNSLVDKFTNTTLPDVWKALLRQCKMGNIAAIKFLFELKGLSPELNYKKESDKQRLELEYKKLAIMEAKAGSGNEELPDDGFLQALESKGAEVWGGEKPCP